MAVNASTWLSFKCNIQRDFSCYVIFIELKLQKFLLSASNCHNFASKIESYYREFSRLHIG